MLVEEDLNLFFMLFEAFAIPLLAIHWAIRNTLCDLMGFMEYRLEHV